jgi:KDO2-lipid IV(A) lauroyltransferase
MQREIRRGAHHLGRWGKIVFSAILGRLAVLFFTALRWTDPDRMADFAARFMRVIGPWLPEHRIGRANLAAAYPDWPAAEVDRVLGGVWDNLGRLGIEFACLDRLWKFDPLRRESSGIEFSPFTIERFERLRDDGRPALIFGAHFANWELSALTGRSLGLDTAVLFRRLNIAPIDRMVREMRSARMGMLIPTGFDAPIRIVEALARNAHVGMLVDQYFARGVDVTFFGRRTKANPLIARLARRIDCPIHGTRVVRLPGKRFRIDLTEAIEPARDLEGKVDIAATMQVITSVIEGWIRENPEQWLWLHRRWR